jgi:orotidine-5'-phosphate decarboxylase
VNPVLVALDVSSTREALSLVDALRGAVGGYKIGSQLFTSEGPDIVRSIVDRGERVFLDLKYHDIPSTVAGAVAAAAELGVWMLNVHASGGRAMLAAARQAASDWATRRHLAAPLVIGVTVLTSLDEPALQELGVTTSPRDHVVRLAGLVRSAGLDGVVASPLEVEAIRRDSGPSFVIVTPGIRGGAASSGRDDQQRTSTAAGAVLAGSSFLVVGRPITGAPDPRAAAARIVEEIAIAREERGART